MDVAVLRRRDDACIMIAKPARRFAEDVAPDREMLPAPLTLLVDVETPDHAHRFSIRIVGRVAAVPYPVQTSWPDGPGIGTGSVLGAVGFALARFRASFSSFLAFLARSFCRFAKA